ncbi:MAG: hypothetical protein KQH67_05845 [Bacteroidetes bacterium]|nr:hypothetical protein [Bacteroidota bacterium]
MISKKMIILALDFRMKYKKRNTRFFGLLTGLLAGFIFILPPALHAQTLEVGASGGVSYYIGDINPGIPFKQSQLAYGALARYNLNKRWSVKFSYTRAKLVGDDLKSNAVENRELNFKSNVNDFALVGEFNFWEYFTGSKKSYFTPYIFGGVGFFTFKPYNFYGDELRELGTEGQVTTMYENSDETWEQEINNRSPYNLWSISFPFGIGFKYSLSKRLALGLEWGMRKTLTDYIDDISTTYYIDGELDDISDPTKSHSAGMQRGNENTMDWYNCTLLSVTYKFNLYGSKKCKENEW